MSLPVASDNRYGPEYLGLRLLKRERGVATFLAEEASSGTAVVIKAMSTVRLTQEAQMRLEHEIAMLHAVDATLLAPRRTPAAAATRRSSCAPT